MNTELELRIQNMAAHMLKMRQADPQAPYPGWSTGELLMVALVINDAALLASMGYTMLEAFDRIDLLPAQLRAIERRVHGQAFPFNAENTQTEAEWLAACATVAAERKTD